RDLNEDGLRVDERSRRARALPRSFIRTGVARFASVLVVVCSLGLGLSVAAEARVIHIVIDDRQPLAAVAGQTIAYEQISGRALGELDPSNPLNATIQRRELSKGADRKAHYVASFVLTKPVDMDDATGYMIHV